MCAQMAMHPLPLQGTSSLMTGSAKTHGQVPLVGFLGEEEWQWHLKSMVMANSIVIKLKRREGE